MGLLIDKVRPGGSGTSNDGNTARRFFNSAEISSEITGLNLVLLHKARTILQVMASGHKINEERFRSYCLETARLYVEEYGWYYMPGSMHKILIHGAGIIKSAVLPIGQLSEEAQEYRNKDLKIYRRSHSRKMSRVTTNEDLFHCLMISSDPYLSSLRKLPRKQSGPINSEVLELLLEPDVVLETATDIAASDTSMEETSDED